MVIQERKYFGFKVEGWNVLLGNMVCWILAVFFSSFSLLSRGQGTGISPHLNQSHNSVSIFIHDK